tara:strand:- start:26 stop:829 length:804 start_codon:yes stop_codon:yes gene_type:complete
MRRKPAVADRFYPSSPKALLEVVKKHTPTDIQKKTVFGVVSPHAGFIYSGEVAGSVYASVEIPDTIILLGPNHTGIGPSVSIMAKGTWDMPQGPVEIDQELGRSLLSASSLLEENFSTHLDEHSLETQIPFIQQFKSEFKIVPICLQKLSLSQCHTLGQAILSGINKLDRKVLIIASSDMSHYESYDNTLRKDKLAIDLILERDPKALYRVVKENRISMCGVVPVTVMLIIANALGAKSAELVKYMTSGEVNGDMNSVVGYAGILVG